MRPFRLALIVALAIAATLLLILGLSNVWKREYPIAVHAIALFALGFATGLLVENPASFEMV